MPWIDGDTYKHVRETSRPVSSANKRAEWLGSYRAIPDALYSGHECNANILTNANFFASTGKSITVKHSPLSFHLPVGTSVFQITATDADDPTYGNSARIVYSILQGQPYFTVDPKTGEQNQSMLSYTHCEAASVLALL